MLFRSKSVGSKYLRGLHVEGDTDRQIHYLLGDIVFQHQLNKYNNELKTITDQLKAIWHNIKSNRSYVDKCKQHILTLEQPFVNLINQLKSFAQEITKFLKFIKARDYPNAIKFHFSINLASDDQNSCRNPAIAIDEIISQIYERFEKEEKIPTEQRNFISELQSLRKKSIDTLRKHNNILWLIKRFQSKELIILSRPGMGKTHLVCHTSENLINEDKPVILLLGAKFSTSQDLKVQIRNQLGIANQYNWDEIVSALEVAAETYRSRLLFIIDALNESPVGVEIWGNQLAEIVSDLTKSVWICTLVTTRESYAEAIFGQTYPQNSYFLSDSESIKEYRHRYFEHFKIKLAHVGPNLLKGLENRFFVSLLCKTYGNPSRKEYSKIDVQDITIADIFEEYIRKCDNAICRRLKVPTGCSIIRKKLLAFAKNIWESNQTSLVKYEAIQLLDGKDPAQVRVDSSYTFAIIHEGLLLDLSWTGGVEVIEFTHQSLGEYLMAVSLIEDKSEEEIKLLLQRKQEHPRLLDVVEWMAFLLPQKLNKHLFEIVLLTDIMKHAQEAALFEISPNLLTKIAISWLYERFEKTNTGVKHTIFTRLFNTAHIPQHPFNAHFLNTLLKKLPMPDRDVIWSEWLRHNSSRLSSHVEYFEALCKNGNISAEDEKPINILALFYVWFLTSTNRVLRDKTTRALYWFGRNNAKKLFELAVQSLTIDDHYVPERMLAASYGVAMALAYDVKCAGFKRKLSLFAKKLYKLMFAKGAPHSTTHILMRDYARRLIELSLCLNPKLLSKPQKRRIIPSFKDGGVRNWKKDNVAKKQLTSDTKATYGFGPIHSDFSRYIVGSISRRGKFQRKNFPTLKESISMIIRRMKQLGYEERKFRSIDQNIVREVGYYRYGASEGIDIERYGKKYSWIAYFELAGFYADVYENGEHWKDLRVRTSDVDIDPSFPEEPQIVKIINRDYLKGKPKTLGRWIKSGSSPNIKEYLIMEKINKKKGPWVLLDGYINQEDLNSKRGLFIFPRGFFLKTGDIKKFLRNKNKIIVAGRSLPEIEDDIYTFAGEIPWCETFPYTKYPKTITIPVGRTKKKVPIKKGWILLVEALQKISKRKKQANDISTIIQKINSKLNKKDQLDHDDLSNLPKEKDFQRGYMIQEFKKIETIDVEVPVRNFGWESYHSTVNYGQNAYVPSRELAMNLGLYIKPQSFDMLDKNGKNASITLQCGDQWHTTHELVYLRKDLLDNYLKRKNKQFVWIIWGERRFVSKDNQGLTEFAKKYKTYRVYKLTIPYSRITESKLKQRHKSK